VLTCYKGNHAKDTTAIAFDIIERDGSTVVVWGAPSAISADELVNQDPKRHGPAPEKTTAARDFLTDLLDDGPIGSAHAVAKGKAAGFSRSLLYLVVKQMISPAP